MVFALTSRKSTSTAKAEKSTTEDLLRDFEAWLVANPSWLEDNGFGSIQAQVITSSTTFPDLKLSNPGEARGFDYWYETIANAGTSSAASSAPVVSDAAVSKPATGGLDPVPSDFVPARCLPIYWEEKTSDPVDVFDKDGVKTGHKIVTTGAGYTTTNTYDLGGLLVSTDYESVYGDSSRTEYETIPSDDGRLLSRAETTGKNAASTWASLEVRDSNGNVIESKFESSDGYTSSMKQSFDAQNNLLESSYESSDGSQSHTKQTFQKAADGQLEKIIVSSNGSGTGYNYKSYSEYDASWNLLSSNYSDGNGYNSSTARAAFVGENGAVQGYSVVSEGGDSKGYWYKSTETLDTNGNLIVSSYEDSSGYFSKRTTERQTDSQWGELIVATDASGSNNDFGKSIYTSTSKYTSDWRTIESESEDSSGNSSKLSTLVKTNAAGEKIYVQTYQYKYSDGSTSEWTTEYNDRWWPLVDGKPIEDLPMLYKQPRDNGVLEPATVPTIAKTAAGEFQTQPTTSASDIVSEKMVMGIAGKTDKLIGSDGNDVFMVNDSGDRIVSGQKGNADSVMAEKFSISLLQKKWDGIENAMLVGSADLNLTGDAGSNMLSGNGGDNIIRGGAGLDTFFGGGGEDIFVLSREKKSIDQVLDFESGEDKIALSGIAFKSLFDKNKKLKDGVIGEKLMVDEKGVLWFDVDGGGKKLAVEIAIIGVQETMDNADFIFMA